MRRIWALGLLTLFGAMVVLGAAGSTRAVAASDTTTTISDQAQVDKCLSTMKIGEPPPTCTFDQNGNLIGRSTPGVGGSASSFNLAPFFLIALLWSAVPLLIAVAAARSRNEPVGLAVLLTLVFGWIGLVVVIAGQRKTAVLDEV